MYIRRLPRKYDDIPALLRRLPREQEGKVIAQGRRRVLSLFHEMARRVPAYKKFLKRHGIKPAKIKTFDDFTHLPIIDKNNYLKKYPLEELCWDGKFSEKHWDISSTSGSTGEPFYFPRAHLQNMQYAKTAELYLRNNFEIHKNTTLYVNCFALGVWIGGLFTYEALKLIAEDRKYPLTVINPGLNKDEAIKAIRKLGDKFDQVILGGYPPFIKDLIDEGVSAGLSWKKYNIGVVFSAENFSEEFREYIVDHAGIRSPYLGTLNHFGTVDQGTLAHETPLSILVRQLVLDDQNFYDALFHIPATVIQVPTVVQYDPELFFFESVDGRLLCSAYSGLPLVRYDLKDKGGVFTFSNLESKLEQIRGEKLESLIKRFGISKDKVWRMPFVYVFERSDFLVTLYGLNIYPEHVRRSIQRNPVDRFLTGKFTMLTKTDRRHNQYLEINFELKKGAKIDRKKKKQLQQMVIEGLRKYNSEYNKLCTDMPTRRTTPRIVIWPYGHKKYFGGEGKQKWSLEK